MTRSTDTIRTRLVELSEEKHADFTAKLAPTVPREHILGVRVPALRTLAKHLRRKEPALVEAFLSSLPHETLEENLLHALILNEEKDFDELIRRLEEFFPVIDNWMVSDIISPGLTATHHEELEGSISQWLTSNQVYPVRVAVQLLMSYYLDDHFRKDHLNWVAAVSNPDYYARMACAWYFATALAKQPHATGPYFFAKADEEGMDDQTRKMAITKACESRRIPDATKEALRKERQRLSIASAGTRQGPKKAEYSAGLATICQK